MTDVTTMCKIEGCERKRVARGLCASHYARGQKAGQFQRPTIEERFWSKVDANGVCWEWTAAKDNKGYGSFWTGEAHRVAHRVSWGMLVGVVPAGLQLDHLCRNRGCVNPDHLEPVTPRENTLRGRSAIKGSHHPNSQKDHCVNGHEYTDENTYTRKNTSWRECRTCRREHKRTRHSPA